MNPNLQSKTCLQGDPADLAKWLSEEWGSLRVLKSNRNLYSRTFVFGGTKAGSTRKVFVKMLESQNGVDDMDHFRAEIRALSLAQKVRLDDKISVPRLYRYSEPLKALACEYVEGENLYNCIWNRRRLHGFLLPWNSGQLELLRDLVRWMHLFHNSSPAASGGCSFKEIVRRDFDSLLQRRAFLKDRPNPVIDMSLVECAIEAADEHLKELGTESFDPVLIHGDLTLSNMICSGRKVYVLDFANSKPGMPEDDFSRIVCDIASLEHRAAWNNKADFQRADSTGELFHCFFEGDRHSRKLLWFYLIKNCFINLTTYANHIHGRSAIRGLRFLCLLHVQQRFLKRIVNSRPHFE